MGSRVFVVMALFAMGIAPVTAVKDETRRLRITDDRTAHFVRIGSDRSPLLRALVARVEAADVVVYLGRAREVDPGFAGRMRWIGAGGGKRYLRVSLNAHLPAHDYVATIAHELQHVIEVIEHPDVRDANALAALYGRIGERLESGSRVWWDTAAARTAGRIAKEEFLSRAERPTPRSSSVRWW